MSTRTGAELRSRRHLRVCKTVVGTVERSRLAVFRSNKHIYVQIIDDLVGCTLVSAFIIVDKVKGAKFAAAESIGKLVAERAKAAGIEAVVFDRGGFRYHGCVVVIAEAVRAVGLKF